MSVTLFLCTDKSVEESAPLAKRARLEGELHHGSKSDKWAASLPPGSQKFPGTEIGNITAPSMEAFWTGYMQSELPVVISGMLKSCLRNKHGNEGSP